MFEDTLYFTNYSSNVIMRVNKFGVGNATDITYGVVKASDVVVIQEYKQMKCKYLFNPLSQSLIVLKQL